MKLDSYLKIRKSDLCDLSANAVVNIENEIASIRKKAIESLMPRFFFRDRTFEEAELLYDKLSFFDDAVVEYKFSISHSKIDLKVAQDYLDISVSAGCDDPVFISAEDWKFLKKWSNK